MRPPLERYEEKVDRSGGPDACHPWMAGRLPTGYGRFSYGGKDVYAHRWAYENYVGPIPEGLQVLHHCDNPPCVNPAHLWLGTHADNHADKVAKGRQARGKRVVHIK